jgi:hypothetical protein
MKKKSFTFIACWACMFAWAQNTPIYWKQVDEKRIATPHERVIIPKKYLAFELVADNLKKALWAAPHEKDITLQNSPSIIELPMPNGSVEKFKVVYSPVMAPELAAQFPNIKTFNVMSIDHPGTFGKIDWAEMEFHGMIRKPSADIFIDPYSRNDYTHYITYNSADFQKDPNHILPESGVMEKTKNVKEKKKREEEKTGIRAAKVCAGTELRTYRLAIACTGEYAKAATGVTSPTLAQTLAKIVTSVNRVDGVYETEVAVKLVLVAAETLVVFTDPATDPFNGNNADTILIKESQSVIDSKIGNANYDVGHTFSTGAGGLASLGVPCQTGSKAEGVTGSTQPVGDPYDIDYVAHELGHQFSGNHTFRASTGGCSGNGNSSTQVEPGSGVTIMAYAGICTATNNVAAHSIPYFHTISFDEIINYTTVDAGNSCPVKTTTTNQAPVVTGSITYSIPKSTPFTLTGSATDPDGDVLTYSWEEIDNNTSSGNWNDGKSPYFRSYNPTASPSRMFPSLNVILSGNTTGTIGEYLPTTAQTLNFRLTARDNKMGGGGVCYENSQVTITNSGPFTVSYPNATGISWGGGSTQTVTWNVNGTNSAPVNCANVTILFSNDGGKTFTTLMNNVPNSGSQLITTPNLANTSTTCRIKIESIGNIFFDINDKDFTVTANPNGIHTVLANNMAMHLFPNPATNQVSINMSGLTKNESNQLVITTILGEVLKEEFLSGKDHYELSWDISNLPSGIYFIALNGFNKRAVSKLIKQ